ncbi:quinoprotein glucose dehydrogenase [Escherichia albertii KF1]|nr:quinoprotein glucose dehydrogenase [Escherichia albertii KF1]
MPFPMPVPVPFNMGMPMLGGPISTAGNVLFIAATADNYLRAYNMSNGEKLWQARLPAGARQRALCSCRMRRERLIQPTKPANSIYCA